MQYISPFEEHGISGFGDLGVSEAVAAKRAAAKVAAANKKSARLAKKAVKVAGKTVKTSKPAHAAKIHAQVTAAQSLFKNVLTLAAAAKKSNKKADIQKAISAASSTGKLIQTLANPPAKAPAAVVKAAKLRGMGYIGTCVADPSDPTGATAMDNGDGQGCDPSTWTGSSTSSSVPTAPQLNTGLSPGFGVPSMPSMAPSLNAGNYAPLKACASGSNLPRCIIYQMALDEQNQFQYVFSILQQMYAQLLTIVQQLMQQLASAQQQPIQQPYNPYPQNAVPTSPYMDPNAQYQQYPQQPYQDPNAQYGGQYQGPAAPVAPAPVQALPAGYDAGGAAAAVAQTAQPIPSPIAQTPPFQNTEQNQGGYPMMSPGGYKPTLVSTNELPVGADQQSYGGGYQDDAGGIVPTITVPMEPRQNLIPDGAIPDGMDQQSQDNQVDQANPQQYPNQSYVDPDSGEQVNQSQYMGPVISE